MPTTIFSPRLLLLLLFAVLSWQCKKTALPESGTAIISFAMERATSTQVIPATRTVNIYMNDDYDRTRLVGVFQLSKGAVAKVKGVEQVSFTTPNDFTKPVTYTIYAQDGATADWTVQVLSNSEQIGLGNVTFTRTIEKPYDFYLDQINTGGLFDGNGGVTCLAMAWMWADFSATVDVSALRTRIEQARATLSPPLRNVLPVYTSELTTELASSGSQFRVIKLDQPSEQIRECIDKGLIVILCPDMSAVRYDPERFHRVGRFYTLSGPYGHFILVKGYKEIGNSGYFFETYDPHSLNQRYEDSGTLKGKSRYYYDVDIERGIRSNWNYAIVVGPKYVIMPELDNVVPVAQLPVTTGY